MMISWAKRQSPAASRWLLVTRLSRRRRSETESHTADKHFI